MMQLACTPCSLYIYIERERGGGEGERRREGERERRERRREGESERESERERGRELQLHTSVHRLPHLLLLPYRHLLDRMLYTVPLLCTCICMYVWL